MDMEKFGAAAGFTFVCAVALGLAGLIVWPAYKSIAADGRIEYCYVENERHPVQNQPDVVLYNLWGFRPWRSDRRLAVNLKSLEEVKAESERLACPLK